MARYSGALSWLDWPNSASSLCKHNGIGLLGHFATRQTGDDCGFDLVRCETNLLDQVGRELDQIIGRSLDNLILLVYCFRKVLRRRTLRLVNCPFIGLV